MINSKRFMKVLNKKNGEVFVIPEGVWKTIVNRGDKHNYQVLDPVPQPKIRDIEQPKEKPVDKKPRKKTKKEEEVVITDLSQEDKNTEK